MEKSSFFNSVAGDRLYDMEAFALYFKQFLSNGLYHTNNAPALLVGPVSGLQTKIQAGSAYIEGFMYQNTEDLTLTHDVADATNPRIDRIILKLDRGVNVRSIKAVIKKGTPATTPQPPALQRDAIVYEISLAKVRVNAGATNVTSITDERLDPSVAGLVSSLITVPTDGFIQDWNVFMSNMDVVKGDYQAELIVWKNGLNSDKLTYETQWNTWFASMQVGTPAMGGITIYVSGTTPSAPTLNDIWIDTL